MVERPIRQTRRHEKYAHLSVPPGVIVRAISGLSAKYHAGSDGCIYCYSDYKTHRHKPKPFRLGANVSPSTGYPFVHIIEDGRRKTLSVHTLVCRAFHGPRPSPVHEVRHLDGDKVNGRPDNLAWGTPAENEADKRRHGRTAMGSKHGIAKLNEEAVRILRVAIPQGLWNPVDAAQVFDCDPSVIRAAVDGKNWKQVV